MKLLFLTTQLPYPPFQGGVIKSWRLVEYFHNEFDLDVVALLKGNDKKNEEAFLECLPGLSYTGIPVDRPRSIGALVGSYRLGKTLNEFRSYSKEAAGIIAERAKTCDAIFVDHYEMQQYVPRDFSGRIVLHEHNAEYVLWQRFAEIQQNPLKKIMIGKEAKRIAKAEKKYTQQADLILASPNDTDALVEIGTDRNKIKRTFHLGEDELLDLPDLQFRPDEKALLYIGTLSWEPNVDGLLWFLEKIWPDIEAANPSVRMYIVGKDPDKRLKEATAVYQRVVLTGFVDDLETYFRKCSVFVVPQRFGSGIKVKVLNAFYRGIPCVTTPVGVEGMSAEDESEVMVAKTAGEFAERTTKLLNEESHWTRLRDNSRKKARDMFRWEPLLTAHKDAIVDLVSH